jgi:hypothetical protein
LSFAPLAAAEEAVSDPRAESLGTLLEAAPAVTGSVARQVERVDFGSRGTTVTLEGGKRIVLDFSGVSGVGGGPNYIGWAMLVFGMMVASRLISAVARLTRPLSLLGRRRRRDDD